MTEPPRTMLSVAFGASRFNYRVAGVVIRNDHVLVCREDDDSYLMLPGGRVELGETSETALKREMLEELGYDCCIERRLFTAEDFFERGGETFHELGIYYQAMLPDTFPFNTEGPALVRFDEGHELTFSWLPLVKEVLAEQNLLPVWTRQWLPNLPQVHEHIVFDEQSNG